ncbi:MAG: NifB/NifX family molybdenum-iron cluster-binding protein [Bacteroidales bacterium]
MKTVISAKGNSKNDLFDPRFGRAAWFCILDAESGETRFEQNEQTEADSGAGVKVAERMVELGVTRVISGHFGPKAKDLLEKFSIQMVVIDDEQQKISELIERIKT